MQRRRAATVVNFKIHKQSTVTIHNNTFAGKQENILHAKNNNNVTFTSNGIDSTLTAGTGDGWRANVIGRSIYWLSKGIF